MLQPRDTVVMTLPHNESYTSTHRIQHHNFPPQNFSRPHQHPSQDSTHSANSFSLSNGGSIGGSRGGVTGFGTGLKDSNNIPNGRPSTLSTSTTASTASAAPTSASRMNSAGVNTAPDRESKPAPGTGTGAGAGSGTGLRVVPSADSSYFPNGSVFDPLSTLTSTQNGVSHQPVSRGSPALPLNSSAQSPQNSMAAKSSALLTTPNPTVNPSRFSNNLPSPGPQLSQQLPATTTIRHRHTLQVPKPNTSRQTTPSGSASDAITSGRFSPTSATTPRRASMSLGRRGTRSLHSDMHIDEIPQDEDAIRWAETIKAKRASKRRKAEEELDDDKVMVGTKVDQNHVNWITAYNMLTGIRFTVSRINAKMDRALTDADFDAKNKFSFDITGNELTPSAKYDFKFKDYSPWVFRHLRAKFRLDPADYLMSLTSKYILSELGSPGKSGSFFYFSRDYKYIIKTIHHGEHRFLRHILRDYYKHVEDNPDTLISQFYGLHRVKTPFGRKIHFVVMNNLFPPHRDIHQTFDLKGSTIGRDFKEENLEENPRATLKDLNWLRRDMNLNFGPTKKELFLQQVHRDVELLKRLHIMDYSLLLGIHDLKRGNSDDIRNNALKVFQPGGSTAEPGQDDLAGHMLQRTPSKMEKARQARELRKIINKEVPITLDRGANRLPEEFLEQKNTVFYGDDGGFQATHENDEPGEVVYYLGIIDCLTHYGFVKRLEHFWRGLSNPKDQVSAIPPDGYGDRFFKFISGHVKSPEEASRDKAARENAPTAEALVSGSSENDVLERARAQADRSTRHGANESDRLNRSLGAVRSPSAERTAGAAGAVLPVVEEAGEGSSLGARTRSHRDSSSDNGRTSGYVDSVTDRRASRETGEEVFSHGKARAMPEDMAIRVARVSS